MKKVSLILTYIVEFLLWLGVAGVVLYVGVIDTDSFLIRLSSVAALWLAGYWTIRTFRAQREATQEETLIKNDADEIKFQKERLEAFLELSHDGIVILDSEQRILRINQAVTDMTGYDAKEVIGQLCSHVFRCEKYKEAGLSFGIAFLTDEKPTHYEEVALTSKDGRQIDIGMRCSRAKKHPGHRGAHLILIRDLSKIHEAETLEHDFVSMTSHQLFTPLSIIRGNVSLLLAEDLGKINPKQRSFLDQSMIATKKMVNLVTELLSISRLEEREIQLAFVPTDLDKLIADTVKQLAIFAKEHEIVLHYEHPKTKPPKITVDPDKITQVLQNLIDNAIKYTPAKGHVTLSLQTKPDQLIIDVKDTGIGIPTADVPKLFQRFYRSSNVLGLDSKGTGLGLYIARVIVERHHGTISVTSDEGHGSTFSVALPR